MFGKRIGVDLGTANVLVYVKGRGIVIAEPAVVAVAQRDNSIVAVGTESREMLGRSPGAIQGIRPMRVLIRSCGNGAGSRTIRPAHPATPSNDVRVNLKDTQRRRSH